MATSLGITVEGALEFVDARSDSELGDLSEIDGFRTNLGEAALHLIRLAHLTGVDLDGEVQTQLDRARRDARAPSVAAVDRRRA